MGTKKQKVQSQPSQPRDSKGRFTSWKTNDKTATSSTGNGSNKSVSNKSVQKGSDKASKSTTKSKSKAKSSQSLENKKSSKQTSSSSTTLVIHNVHLIDRSGSMAGNKYTAAITGVNEEMENLKKNKTVGVVYTQSIFEFNGCGSIVDILHTHCFKLPIDQATKIKGKGAADMTPLYQSLGHVIEQFTHIGKDEKVLLTIFTDGGENSSKGKYKETKVLYELIKEAENKGYTITFMGTQHDTDEVIRNLGIDKSNTLVHENTASSISNSYGIRGMSAQVYTKSALEGKDVKIGFFVNEPKK